MQECQPGPKYMSRDLSPVAGPSSPAASLPTAVPLAQVAINRNSGSLPTPLPMLCPRRTPDAYTPGVTVPQQLIPSEAALWCNTPHMGDRGAPVADVSERHMRPEAVSLCRPSPMVDCPTPGSTIAGQRMPPQDASSVGQQPAFSLHCNSLQGPWPWTAPLQQRSVSMPQHSNIIVQPGPPPHNVPSLPHVPSLRPPPLLATASL
jgi:hypothetical protein